MKQDTPLANDLVVQSLIGQIAKLTARIEVLEQSHRRQVKRENKRNRVVISPREALLVTPILERAARMNGTTLPEILAPKGTKRAVLARAEAAYECHRAGITEDVIGAAMGQRTQAQMSFLIKRHKDRMGIK